MIRIVTFLVGLFYLCCFNLGLHQILALTIPPRQSPSPQTAAAATTTAASITSITSITSTTSATKNRFPFVYVYTVVPRMCSKGLPLYIKTALEQSIFSQPDSDTLLVSNFAECKPILDSVRDMPRLTKIDSTKISSSRATAFLNASATMFGESMDPLWVTSALRFFIMEDLMISRGYTEMIHVEADNMLYGPFSTILEVFRKGYKNLAATPLNDSKTFITASVVWIASLGSMQRINDFFLALGYNKDNIWTKYIDWLRPYATKQGGYYPDKNGVGVKPFAINEMSMLAYYHEISPEEMMLLPVVPAHNYNLNKYVCNMSRFGPGGPEVGPATGDGVWDPNSWGQFIGGTSSRKGRDIGFTDSSHISGQAIRMSGCTVTMECGNHSQPVFSATRTNDTATEVSFTSSAALTTSADGLVSTNQSTHGTEIMACYTAPYVKCGNGPHTSLWNLHVHSKHTLKFKSSICPCPVTKVAS